MEDYFMTKASHTTEFGCFNVEKITISLGG